MVGKTIHDARNLILIGAYAAIVSDAVEFGHYLPLEKYRQLLPGLERQGLASRNVMRIAFIDLVGEQYFEHHANDKGEDYWSITLVGIRRAEADIAANPSLRGHAQALLEHAQEKEVPAAALSNITLDSWEPIPVDLSSEQAEVALISLEKVRDEFRKENGFASTEPEKKRVLLSMLDQGIDAFKAKLLTKLTISTLVIAPLNSISSIFGKAAVGELAKIAIAAIRAAFGI